jgi:cytochrome P450
MTLIPDGIELTPFSDSYYADPYEVYARLRSREPVHRDNLSMYEKSWTITNLDSIKLLLTDSRLSVDSTKVGIVRDPRANNPVTTAPPNMMGLDGPDHRRLRNLVQKAFTPAKVEGFRSKVERIVDSRIEQLKDIELVDLVPAYAKPIPTIAIAEFLGVDPNDHVKFKNWTDSLLKQGYPLPTETQWDEIVAADKALHDYMRVVVQKRRRKPEDDLISAMIRVQSENEGLQEDEVVEMCSLLIGAGNFTTTDLISNSILAFLQYPGQIRLLLDNELTIEIFIEECLRFDSPSMIVRRFALEDIVLNGETILKGSVVNLVLGAANHDPSHFSRPDEFSAEVDRNRHFSFGRGVHHCLGASLARLEAQVAVKKLIDSFPQMRLLDHSRTKNLWFRGCRSLRVELNMPKI